MIIDVVISSCARIDVLESSLFSFKEKVRSNTHEFRWIIIEDNVNDKKRQNIGKKFINEHSHLFDEVHFLEEKAGKGFWWQEALKRCKSDYHIHLEDDNEFITKINIDPIIKLMKSHSDIIEVIFSRGTLSKRLYPKKVKIDGIKLTEMESFSMAAGIFNTKLTWDVVEKLGWKTELHEAGNLAPTTKKMGLRKFMLGHNKKHYIHVGAVKGYKKGEWKK